MTTGSHLQHFQQHSDFKYTDVACPFSTSHAVSSNVSWCTRKPTWQDTRQPMRKREKIVCLISCIFVQFTPFERFVLDPYAVLHRPHLLHGTPIYLIPPLKTITPAFILILVNWDRSRGQWGGGMHNYWKVLGGHSKNSKKNRPMWWYLLLQHLWRRCPCTEGEESINSVKSRWNWMCEPKITCVNEGPAFIGTDENSDAI